MAAFGQLLHPQTYGRGPSRAHLPRPPAGVLKREPLEQPDDGLSPYTTTCASSAPSHDFSCTPYQQPRLARPTLVWQFSASNSSPAAGGAILRNSMAQLLFPCHAYAGMGRFSRQLRPQRLARKTAALAGGQQTAAGGQAGRRTRSHTRPPSPRQPGSAPAGLSTSLSKRRG